MPRGLTVSGQAAILAHPDAPTHSELYSWTDQGFLKRTPEAKLADGRTVWCWTPEQRRIAITMTRLVKAGFRPRIASYLAHRAVERCDESGVWAVKLRDGVQLYVEVPRQVGWE